MIYDDEYILFISVNNKYNTIRAWSVDGVMWIGCCGDDGDGDGDVVVSRD
jgi:hypothetical protein